MRLCSGYPDSHAAHWAAALPSIYPLVHFVRHAGTRAAPQLRPHPPIDHHDAEALCASRHLFPTVSRQHDQHGRSFVVAAKARGAPA